MKLARSARRTAKRRAFLTKMRAKKRKGSAQLKKRAFSTVRRMLRKRLFKGNWSKLSYGQRKRYDEVINKRKKFMSSIVKQIMPKVIKGESERLKKVQSGKQIKESFILEEPQTIGDKRVAARRRKQAQRSREKEIRQSDPSQMAMVVRDKNNRIIIVDKDSYEPQNHIPVVKPQDMNYSVALKVSQDPSFKPTITAQRILGDQLKSGPPSETPETSQPSGGGAPSVSQQQQSMGVPTGIPLRDTTVINSSIAKWLPGVALNVLRGMSVDQQIKAKLITPEQAQQFMFSENMQEFGQEIAQKLAEAFYKLTGRNINEYQMNFVGEEPMEMSELWVQNQANTNNPKTDIVFTHLCVSESTKDKRCAESVCACEQFGVSPEEQTIKINVKFGNVSFLNGKANGDVRSIISYMQQKIAELLSGSTRIVIDQENYINESDKKSLEIIGKHLEEYSQYMSEKYKDMDIRISMNAVNLTSKNKMKECNDNYLQQIIESRMETARKLRDIFSTSRIAQKLFLHEVLTGAQKYNNSIASATHLLAIDPDSLEIKLNKIDEALIDQILDSEKFVLDVNFKSIVCNSLTEMKSWKKTVSEYIDLGKEVPEQIDPTKFCGRQMVQPDQIEQVKEDRFKFSILSALFEQEVKPDTLEIEQVDPQDRFENNYLKNILTVMNEMLKNKKSPIEKYQVLLTILNSVPNGIFTSPIDLFDAIEDRDGIKVTPITINGRQRFINVMNIPIFNVDNPKTLDNVNEHYSFAKKFLSERKSRNYRREYDTFQGTEQQKKNRAKRNRNRRRALRNGTVRKGDGKDIHHVDGNPNNNHSKNLRVVDKSYNRSKK